MANRLMGRTLGLTEIRRLQSGSQHCSSHTLTGSVLYCEAPRDLPNGPSMAAYVRPTLGRS